MLDYQGLDTGYSIAISAIDELDANYSWSPINGSTVPLDGSYAYYRKKGVRCEAQVGWWSHWTQAIANGLPLWHAGRNNEFCRTQRLINIFAQEIEEADRLLQEERRNRFIGTVDIFQPDKSYRIPITVPLRDQPQYSESKNLVANSDFSIPGLARYNVPWGWTDRMTATTGLVEHYTANALTGTGCVRMKADAGEVCYLRQLVHSTLGAEDCVTASAWVNVPVPVDAPRSTDSAKYALVLTVLYADGTTTTSRVAIPAATAGGWRRIETTVSCDRRVFRADVMFVVDNEDGDSTWEVFVDGVQLEGAPGATSYERPLTELPHWLENRNRSLFYLQAVGAATERTVEHESGYPLTYSEYQHTKVWITQDKFDWWLQAVPTRTGSITATSGLSGTTRTRWGFEAESETKVRRNAAFQIGDNQIQYVVEDTPADILFSHDIADHFMDGADTLRDEYGIYADDDESFSVTIEALTVHRNMLWVVVKETFEGSTIRVLKVLRPAQRPDVLADDDQDNFLETIQDFRLDDADGTVTSVAFVEGNDAKLVMQKGDDQYSLDLYFDYAFWTTDLVTAALLRHNYSAELVVS